MTVTTDQAIELHERALTAFAEHRWKEAERDACEARTVFAREDGPDSPDAANISNLLAAIAEALAQYGAAESYARHAWEIMERLGDRCTGPDASAIRREALGRIGASLRAAEKYADAEIWLQRAVEFAERDGCGVAGARNNLAVLYKYTGKFEQAERLY